MIGMSGERALEHFKEVFPPQIEDPQLETNNIDIAVGKVRLNCHNLLGLLCKKP